MNGLKYWDPEESTRTKWETTYAAELQNRGLTQDFTGLSELLLGQAQPKQFQSYDDNQPLYWSWGSKVSDDGQYTLLNSFTNNANTEMPREYHGGNDSYGDLYNWYSATAESGKYSILNSEANDSLCPHGWRLPAGDITELGSWYYLFTDSYSLAVRTSDAGSDTDDTKFLRTEPLSLSLPGYIHYNSAGQISERGLYGLFWSGRSSDHYGTARHFRFNIRGRLSPEHSDASIVGFSVRCVKK